ncbi:helix-turn-helix domain-containing protein [Weizmannia acidilactici]
MVVQLYQTGTPVKQICSKYGLPEATVYKWISFYVSLIL